VKISVSTSLEPRIYDAPDGIEILRDSLVLDGKGARLIGSGKGSGVHFKGIRNVEIKNLSIFDYAHGIQAERSRNLVIQNCRFRQSAELPPNSTFLDIFRAAADPYGGAILLVDVHGARLLDNDMQHQMHGLLSYHSGQLEVRRNLANYCSGAGFGLHDTQNSLFENNYADFCCRWQARGSRLGHMGADAAGFLIVEGSNLNVFRRNFARLGGDGFFLSGLTHDLRHLPCNHNLFEANDASWSPNIAFEATFSSGNIFRENFASHSNYGFWLGFSRENILSNNQIHGNRAAGIAGENGIQMQVRDNDIAGNPYGILLWSKRIPAFDAAVPENDTSRDWWIENNRFSRNRTAIRIAADQDHGVRDFRSQGICPPLRTHYIQENIYEGNIAKLESDEGALG